MSVVILYGTETGNGELVADAIADTLAADHDPSIYDMSEYAVEDLDPEDFLVIVCSTYGEGELPTGAEMLSPDEFRRRVDAGEYRVFNQFQEVYDITELALMVHADGFGTQGMKRDTWNVLRADSPNVYWGWKNFIDEDRPMLDPAATMQMSPDIVFVSYQ